MFEDRTFEVIIEEMMEDAPNGIDTQEGSLLWNACAKQAVKLEEAYADLERVWDNMLVDTQDLDFLIRSGAECGVFIEEATPAVFKAQFTTSAEIGDRFSHIEEEYNYVIIEQLDPDQNLYKVECEEAGAEPNTILGEIEPIEYEKEIEGELLELVIPGVDQEDEEAYRQRRLENFGIKPFGGNQAYYKQVLKGIEGVGGMKMERRLAGEKAVMIVVISELMRRPTQEQLAFIQNEVDPGLAGTGDGLAPVGATVKIMGADEITINVEASIIYDEGFAASDVKSYIENKINECFKELASTWETSTQLVVRRSRLNSAIMEVEGVLDVTDIILNGIATNYILGKYEIPVRGDVVC